VKDARSILLISLALSVLLMPAAPRAQADSHSGFMADYLADLERTGQRMISLAEAVPAEKYSWSPTDEVRTVSEVYMHVVGTNYLLPVALGAAPPEGMEMPENPFALMQEWEQTVTEKDAVVAKLQSSLDYALQAIPTLADMDEQVELFGPPRSRRAFVMIILDHVHEHLGQSIAYARSIGVVPPWSHPQEETEEGGEESGAGEGE
jgi:uncharacterized damage-inducible protein DinB